MFIQANEEKSMMAMPREVKERVIIRDSMMD